MRIAIAYIAAVVGIAAVSIIVMGVAVTILSALFWQV